MTIANEISSELGVRIDEWTLLGFAPLPPNISTEQVVLAAVSSSLFSDNSIIADKLSFSAAANDFLEHIPGLI